MTSNTPHPLTHLAVIEVGGDDAAQFLQGQLSCNIHELTDAQASLAAFCTAKGRVISVLLVVKTASTYLLVLPRSLMDKVLKKLQMYILRSKVTLDSETNWTGIYGFPDTASIDSIALGKERFACCRIKQTLLIRLPSQRILCIGDVGVADSNLAESSTIDEQTWRFLDISAGLPWFDEPQSEKHIPQTLNIDQLGGISFNKGCYTGQEIVARTHYLGQHKRKLLLAECLRSMQNHDNLAILNAENREKIGEVLTMQSIADKTRLLIVLQTVDEQAKNLILDDAEQSQLSLISFQ